MLLHLHTNNYSHNYIFIRQPRIASQDLSRLKSKSCGKKLLISRGVNRLALVKDEVETFFLAYELVGFPLGLL